MGFALPDLDIGLPVRPRLSGNRGVFIDGANVYSYAPMIIYGHDGNAAAGSRLFLLLSWMPKSGSPDCDRCTSSNVVVLNSLAVAALSMAQSMLPIRIVALSSLYVLPGAEVSCCYEAHCCLMAFFRPALKVRLARKTVLSLSLTNKSWFRSVLKPETLPRFTAKDR